MKWVSARLRQNSRWTLNELDSAPYQEFVADVSSVRDNQKWGLYPANMPWRYHICIAKCLYPYGEDLPQKFGQNHCPRMQKVDFRLTCLIQKRLCLTTSIEWKCSLSVFVWMVTLQDFVHRLWQKLEKYLSNNNQVGHFWVPKPLTLKTRLRAKPFSWKWLLFVWEHLASLENTGLGQLGSGLFFL